MEINPWRVLTVQSAPEILYEIPAGPMSGEIHVTHIAAGSHKMEGPPTWRGELKFIHASPFALGWARK